MNKIELASAISEKTGLPKKESTAALNACLDAVSEALAAEDKVQLTGFGAFEVKQRNARTGINPRTKETIEIPAFKAVVFKPGKTLKDKI